MEDESQHFLSSPKARTLTVAQVAQMSEEEAYAVIVALRFAENDGVPFCIKCKCPVVYDIKRKRTCKTTGEIKIRPMFKCADCLHQFSVTSGTSLRYHKLGFRQMLHIVSLFTQGAKGVSALQISRMTGHAYMTTFVLDHKLREGLLGLQMAQQLDGVVEADSAYFGGKVRMTNRAGPDGKRRVRKRTKKWSATVARSRSGGIIVWPKSEKEAVPFMREKISAAADLITDQSPSFNTLGLFFRHHRIDHSKAYSENGISTNLAESSWSRVRRGLIGVYHKIGEPYRDAYLNEFGWREDNRRKGNGEQFLTIAAATLHSPKSDRWTGYWQRRKSA